VIAESETLGAQRWVVDLETGLVISTESTDTAEKGTLTSYTVVTDLAPASAIPDTPPPPDGFEWEQLWSTARDLRTATIEETREAFGSGLILPASAIDDGVVALGQSGMTADWAGVDPDDPAAVVREVTVVHVEPAGLLQTRFSIQTSRPTSDTVPEGYIATEDRLCQGPCDTQAGDLIPDAGALAGVPVRGSGGYYEAGVNGVWIQINAPTEAAALALINTLVQVG
jgi:hypothetical protein